MKIIVDSRERRPLDFHVSTRIEGVIVRKLDVGDYSIEGMEDQVAIERKSASDLFGTLGKNHKRFNREIDRAKDYDYFAVVVEANYSDIKYKNFENAFYCKIPGYIISQICMTLKLKHGIDFIFCKDRKEAKDLIRDLLFAYSKLKGEKNAAPVRGHRIHQK